MSAPMMTKRSMKMKEVKNWVVVMKLSWTLSVALEVVNPLSVILIIKCSKK